MSQEEKLYTEIGQSIASAEQSQLVGRPYFKVNGKAFISFFQNYMVFKLTDQPHREALNLDGAQRFDPSGKKRPMKEGVQLPFDYVENWEEYAQAAFDYVKANT